MINRVQPFIPAFGLGGSHNSANAKEGFGCAAVFRVFIRS